MTEIQTYLDAIAYLAANTEVLTRLAWTLIASSIMGAFFLNRFKIWLWVIFLLAFMILTQWQVDMVMRDLGFTPAQIMPPHMITVISGLIFMAGSGLGYWIKTKKIPKYAEESPAQIAVKVMDKINGGAIETSSDAKYQNY